MLVLPMPSLPIAATGRPASANASPAPRPPTLDGRDDRFEEGKELLRSARERVSDGRGVELGLIGWTGKKVQGTAPFSLVAMFTLWGGLFEVAERSCVFRWN